VILRYKGKPWGEFFLRQDAFGKTVSLVLRREMQSQVLAEFTVLENKLCYTAPQAGALGGKPTDFRAPEGGELFDATTTIIEK
jgi:hypothetical protein